ncbi:MAG TPA: hypothetical protein VGV60_04505 [Candidatus Polarisedimenticolia bacterium]|jgi:hypothetical protein|nr:hypothetical protein [Candidatus Polarisedimenticolia bacterium]
MSRSWLLVLLLATGVALADEAPEAKPEAAPTKEQEQRTEAAKQKEQKEQKEADAKKKKEDAKSLSGMSVLGNQEAPKALVIVPWKSSEIGASLGSSTMLDDSRQPIDKEVFMRVLSYYEVRSTTTRHDAAQPAAAPHRR